MASCTHAGRADACVSDDLGDHCQALRMPQRPKNAYMEHHASVETTADLRGSAMEGSEGIAAPARPFACNHDNNDHGSIINPHSGRRVNRNAKVESRKKVDEREDDDDGQQGGHRWDSWGIVGFTMLVSTC